MGTNHEERRASGVKRVDHTALVEICGHGDKRIFQAESLNVSGRGMHVRCEHLPSIGDPLVLRFSHEDQEAVIEGQVAWTRECQGGGDVGIKFTALDSPSVRVLRTIVTSGGTPRVEEETEEERPELQQGAAVRLHLDGLGAPMKARVFEGGRRGVQVGSQLEFLRMGQQIELEQVGGEPRLAQIDSVSVCLDPETDIPQLVLSLLFDGEEREETPAPTVVDDEEEDFSDEEPELSVEQAEALFKGRVEVIAGKTSAALREGSAVLKGSAEGLVSGMRSLLPSGQKDKPRAQTRRQSYSQTRMGATRKRGPVGQRPSVRAKSAKAVKPKLRLKDPRILAAALATAIFGSGAYVLFSGGPGSEPIASAPVAPLPSVAPVAVAPSAAVAASSALPEGVEPVAPGAVQVNPGEFPPPATLNQKAQAQANSRGIVANVPLFGPQQMATSEPAPTQPPKAAVVDEYGMAKDLTFASRTPSLNKAKPAVQEQEEAPSVDSAPAEDKVWQVGRMHLPIIHRLRLDGPGAAIQGTKTANGFKILIPGRKVMENGSQIAKRDDRIAGVRVKNTPAGGTVSFRFRSGIPGYKARLRKDYIEFFINSPEK